MYSTHFRTHTNQPFKLCITKTVTINIISMVFNKLFVCLNVESS